MSYRKRIIRAEPNTNVARSPEKAAPSKAAAPSPTPPSANDNVTRQQTYADRLLQKSSFGGPRDNRGRDAMLRLQAEQYQQATGKKYDNPSAEFLKQQRLARIQARLNRQSRSR